MSNCCQFGANLTGENSRHLEPWDEVLFESANFVAVPTLGALIEGWLLLVPRDHHLCIGSFSPDLLAEFQEFREEVHSALTSIYGSVVTFEHGPARTGQPAGCGVDHAHLHLVPWRGLFGDTIREHSPIPINWRYSRGFLDLIELHQTNETYLYYEESSGEARYGLSDSIPSQFFRQVIARATNQADSYDWKSHSGIELIQSTITVLTSANNLRTSKSEVILCV